MQGQQAGTNLYCIYRDCEDLALFGDYCKAHQFQRAEAAESRAADAEVHAKSWHDLAMTLADQRDAAYKRNTELEAALNDIKANTYMPDGTRLSDAVKQVMQERDELARKLEQAHQREESLCDEIEKRNEIIRGYADLLSEATA